MNKAFLTPALLWRRSIAALGIMLLTWGASGAQQSGSARYEWLLTDIKGNWEHRDGAPDGKPVAGPYFPVKSTGELRCMDEVSVCRLSYVVQGDKKLEPFPIQPAKRGEWIRLSTIVPPRAGEVIPPPIRLKKHFELNTQLGAGGRSGSGCGGALQLRAPVCGDTVNIADFTIQWAPTFTGTVTILVETADGRAEVLRRTAPASSGKYADEALVAFISRLQDPNVAVHIVVRLVSEDGREGVRLVHIPSRIQAAEYRRRADEVEALDPFIRTLRLQMLAIDQQMWTEAALQALQLLKLAPDAPQVRVNALEGLCLSSFDEERSRLRSQMPRAVSEEICPLSVEPVSSTSLISDRAPGTGQTGKRRLGLALLLGNSEYWNTTLNSVNSDIREMEKTLTSLGFEVTIRENLREPRQFQDIVLDIGKNARPDDIFLVYYSGHGLQLDGKAQLLGTGTSSSARLAEEVRSNAQSVDGLIALMERPDVLANKRIFIVDACRDNVFSSTGSASLNSRSAPSLQQDVPNTIVMFANRPGLPAPIRSDYGLMGPFTESLVDALKRSRGDVFDVFRMAKEKTSRMSPGQAPEIYFSKEVSRITFAFSARDYDNRVTELLILAESFYRQRAWPQFLDTVDRARVITDDPELAKRLEMENKFANLIAAAEGQEEARQWKEAGANWEAASRLFPVRRWVALKSAVAMLHFGDIRSAVVQLSRIAVGADDPSGKEASTMLAELLAASPEHREAAEAESIRAIRVFGQEFELRERN